MRSRTVLSLWAGVSLAVLSASLSADCGSFSDRTLVTEVELPAEVFVGAYRSNTLAALQRAWQRPMILAIAPDQRLKLAWSDGKTAVHVTEYDTQWPPKQTADYTLATVGRVYDLVAHPDGFAVLAMTNRGMNVARYDSVGKLSWQKRLISNSSREDFHTGRLAWNGQVYAAYYGISGGGHEGDALTYLDDKGNIQRHAWTWGCSHSMDVRIHPTGGVFLPVCVSDAYPGTGIYFNHNALKLAYEWGDAAGGVGARLGGYVEHQGKMYLVYNSNTGTGGDWNVAMSAFDVNAPRKATPKAWITDLPGNEVNAKLAAYGNDLLVTWSEGGTLDVFAQLVTSDLKTVGTPEKLDAVRTDAHADFKTLANGDIVFASTWADKRKVQFQKIRYCR